MKATDAEMADIDNVLRSEMRRRGFRGEAEIYRGGEDPLEQSTGRELACIIHSRTEIPNLWMTPGKASPDRWWGAVESKLSLVLGRNVWFEIASGEVALLVEGS